MTSTHRSDDSKDQPGSPHMGEPEFLVIGRLGRTHGVKGEIFMTVLTDFPERIVPGLKVFIGPDYNPATIKSCRWINQGVLIAFEGYSNPEKATAFRNQFIQILASDRPPLPEGEYYYHQLLGLAVITEDGQMLGSIIEILETVANDVYVVQTEDKKEILLPAIDQVVLGIDLEKQTIMVRLLPGLIPEE
jgi:16S rRNA processing protein RimM